MEPVDFDQPTQNHPVDVGKCLKSKNIKGFQDIQMIGKFRFKVTFETAAEANKLVRVDLQDDNLKCYVPQMLKQTLGIIKDVPWKYEDRELLEELESEIPILKAERMQKMDEARNLKKTRNVRMTFRGKNLPNTVAMYGYRFKVDLYLFPVKQCQNCWGYGHKTTTCRRPKKCMTCGGRHEEHDQQQCQTECINCRGNHPANSTECPEKKKQRKIAEKMQQEKLSYQEAKNGFLQNQFQLLEDYEDEFPGFDTDERRPEAGTSSGRGRAWTRRPSYRSTMGRGNERKEQPRSNRPGQIARDKPNERDRAVFDNPHKCTEIERVMAEIRAFWRNVSLIGRLKQLQEAIKEEVNNKLSELSYEQVIIKTCTVIGDIIEEVVNNMATSEETNRKSTEQNNESNGE